MEFEQPISFKIYQSANNVKNFHELEDNNIFQHLIKYQHLTDDTIIKINSSGFGIDAVSTMLMMVERDFCKSISSSLIKTIRDEII
jgi:hypothetical protein